MCLGIPGRILEAVHDDPKQAVVEVMGVRRRVDLALIEQEQPKPGDWVLIHVGFAMSKISEEDALETMRMLESLAEAEAAITDAQGYGLTERLEDRQGGPQRCHSSVSVAVPRCLPERRMRSS